MPKIGKKAFWVVVALVLIVLIVAYSSVDFIY